MRDSGDEGEGVSEASSSARVLVRRLRYGDFTTRRELADAIGAGDEELAQLLARTARSQDDWQLRSRCVEVLGLALSTAHPELARRILRSLLDPAVKEI